MCKGMRSGEAGAGRWDCGQLIVAGMSDEEGRSIGTSDRLGQLMKGLLRHGESEILS